MNLVIKQALNYKIIYVEGDIDLYNSLDLRNHIYSHIADGVRAIILSFKGVHYMDSSGIGALLHITRMAGLSKIPIIFAEMSTPVMNIIELTKLRSFFPIVATIEEAFLKINSELEV